MKSPKELFLSLDLPAEGFLYEKGWIDACRKHGLHCVNSYKEVITLRKKGEIKTGKKFQRRKPYCDIMARRLIYEKYRDMFGCKRRDEFYTCTNVFKEIAYQLSGRWSVSDLAWCHLSCDKAIYGRSLGGRRAKGEASYLTECRKSPYFGCIKFGKTLNFQKRLAGLESKFGCHGYLLVVPGDFEDEWKKSYARFLVCGLGSHEVFHKSIINNSDIIKRFARWGIDGTKSRI